MSWCLDLLGLPCQTVQILDGAPRLLAIWTSPQEVHFFEVETGAFYGTQTLLRPAGIEPGSEAWRVFVEGLYAPNGVSLPVVETGEEVIHSAYDGRLRVYWTGDERLLLDVDGYATPLSRETRAPLLAIGLDRDLGTIYALAEDGALSVYQQHVSVGAFQVGVRERVPSAVYAPDASGTVVLVREPTIEVRDMLGRVLFSQTVSAPVVATGCSAGGTWLAVAEGEGGLLHVYDERLIPCFEGDGAALLAPDTPVQAVLAETANVVEALAVADDGTLVVGGCGAVCCTKLGELIRLPQTRRLF